MCIAEISADDLQHVVGGNDDVAKHCDYIGNIHLTYALGRAGGLNVPLAGELPDVPPAALTRNRAWKQHCNDVGNGMAADGKGMDAIKLRINAMPYRP